MKVFASTDEKFAIILKLKEVGRQNEDKTYSYNDGWTDERVAREVAPRLNKSVVNHIRTTSKHFGPFYKIAERKTKEEIIQNRLKALENIVSEMARKLNSLENKRTTRHVTLDEAFDELIG